MGCQSPGGEQLECLKPLPKNTWGILLKCRLGFSKSRVQPEILAYSLTVVMLLVCGPLCKEQRCRASQ